MKKALILISLLLTLLSCEEEDKNKFKFMIISTGGSFDAHYVINGESVETVSPADIKNDAGSTQYTYEKSLDNPTSIKVVATGKTGTNSIYVYIFENSTMVKEGSDSITETGDIATVSVYHEFSQGDESAAE